MKVSPWKKVGAPRTLARSHGKFFRVQQYQDPRTQEIKEFSQFGGEEFASIIFGITKEEEVLVIRQFRHASNSVILELPGGTPKNGEHDAELIARREFAEETEGYVPQKIIPLSKYPLWFDPSSFLTPFRPYLFTGCQQSHDRPPLDRGEYVKVDKIPVMEWIDLISKNEVVDAKSITITFLALRHINLPIKRNA